MTLFLTLLALLSGSFVYLTPTIIASARNVKSFTTIFMLNIFLGWSGIVWFICLIWAVIGEKEDG